MIARSGPSGDDLLAHSIRLIRKNQSANGAYVASPTFPTYQYSWLRDGSFIGYAMLRAGETDSCRRYLEWADATIVRNKERMCVYAGQADCGPPPPRFTIDGDAVDDGWPSPQIDGYGAWLWLLAQYVSLTGHDHLLHRFRESIRLTVDYLCDAWTHPCYDCWEENGEQTHTSTLACAYGGLRAINRLLGERDLHELAESIRAAILDLVSGTRFRKSSTDDGVDASLLWISTPFRVVEPRDPRMRETVKAIDEQLLVEGGVKRYPTDTYYGGGRWLLLTCWLGWYYTEIDRGDAARVLLKWVESHAAASGDLPEQVTDIVNEPSQIEPWVRKWGPVATPLLWSHAMYVILRTALEARA